MSYNETKSPRIVVLSGSPGTGKSTISRILAEDSITGKAVHLEVDDFWQSIRKGYVYPWLSSSGNQNETVNKAVASSAKTFSNGGYEVFVAGTIGPWFLEPWIKIARMGVDVRYIILRPDEETTIMRATQRQQREFFPLNVETIKNVCGSFASIGQYEAHTLDSTGQSIAKSVAVIKALLSKNHFCL